MKIANVVQLYNGKLIGLDSFVLDDDQSTGLIYEEVEKVLRHRLNDESLDLDDVWINDYYEDDDGYSLEVIYTEATYL